VEVILTSIY